MGTIMLGESQISDGDVLVFLFNDKILSLYTKKDSERKRIISLYQKVYFMICFFFM